MTTVKPGWQGRYYEDFEVADIYVHPLGRTITETDNIWFTLLTMNTAAIHFDSHFAQNTPFKKPLVDSTLTLAIVTGMSVVDVSMNVMANLGWNDVVLPNPLFNGDTLYARSEVLSKRESKSRPEVGIVEVKSTGTNQDSVTVIEFKRTVMVWKRGQGPRLVKNPAHP